MSRSVLLAGLLLLAGCVGASGSQHDSSALAVAVARRFGEALTERDMHGDHWNLTLRLADARWHGLRQGLPDSARAVARFALAKLDSTNRPDTIKVWIQTLDRGVFFFRQTGSSGFTFAVRDLQGR